MIRHIATIACLLLSLSSASAQQPHHSEVTVGHPGVEALKADIRYLLSLTSPEERDQQENVVGIIEIMELGLDPSRPFRVDILSGMNPPSYIVSAAYTKSDDLIDNIEGAEFLLKASGANLWEILPPEQGWFRILPAHKTAILAFSTPATHALIRQLIGKLMNPIPVVDPLLAGGANIAIQLKNKAESSEDQKLRRDSFAELRAVRMDALQKRPSERSTRFDIRKELVSIQIDEVERLLVEAASASAKIVMDKKQGTANVSFDAIGIAGSSFSDSLKAFGPRQDAFASVKKAEGAILLVQTNTPIDDLRKGNFVDMIDLIETDAVSQMQKNEKLSADERVASADLAKGFMKVIRDTVNRGEWNGYAQTTLDREGEFVTCGAFAAKDGNRLDDTLALIAKTGAGNKIQPAVVKIGDVTVHEVTFAKGYFRPFDLIFEGKTGYIGTSKDVVWIGTGGKSALEPLKAAIADLKEPAVTDVIMNVEGNALPWAKRAKRVMEAEEEPTAASEKIERRDNLRRLGLAVDAFSAKDDLRYSIGIKDGKAEGNIFANTGTLRFVGKLLADFSKYNLE